MRRPRYRGKRRVYCGRSRTAKIRYKTLTDAKVARSHLSHTGDELSIYRCPTCDGYHLTSETGERNRRTAWKSPDSTVSSSEEPNHTEENRDDRL